MLLNAQSTAKVISGRQSNRTRQKNKRGDLEKWDQTDSPEIPDRGETSESSASLRQGDDDDDDDDDDGDVRQSGTMRTTGILIR